MKNYLERFKAMVKELEDNPKIIVKRFEIKPPATEAELASVEGKIKLTRDMVDFYTEANGLELEWELKDSVNQSTSGNVNLLPVQNVFGDWKGAIYFDWEGGDTFKALHPVDFFVPEACAAFNLDGSENPEIYYHYCGEEMESMKIKFREYLELLLKSRGFWYWQTAVAAGFKGVGSTETVKFMEIMPEIFPDFDSGDFLL